MPLVQIGQFLVLDAVVDLETFYPVLVHEVLDYRSYNLFIYLMDTERSVGRIPVF